MRVLPAIFVLSVAPLCATTAVAQSQPWLGDRRFGGGMGLRAGDFELHPGIAGEVGFDSNFYQASGRVTPDGAAAVIPEQFQPVQPDGSRFGATGTFNEPTV